ncbi:hypothetical protein [Nesterenkonia suensis]
MALMDASCSTDASSLGEAAEEPVPETSAEDETQTDDIDVAEPASMPLSEEHLAEGEEMPDCLEDGHDHRVEGGSVFTENDVVVLFCPRESAEDRVFRPSQMLFLGDEVEILYLDGEEGAGVEVHHLHCEDADALAEKAQHNGESQPAGWPQDWDGEGAMPDPYCHPDYLEVGEWEDLEAFTSAWEGIETSTLNDLGQSQDEVNVVLWEQSQARANWSE